MTPLVLHICCAPDEAWVVQTLSKTRSLRCFFCNPNIAPLAEYQLRLAEAAKVAAHYGVPFDSADYTPQTWESAIADFVQSPEGGERCRECYLLRLRETAHFTASIGWQSFTTVMSVSPHKRIALLNQTGQQAAGENGVTYEPFDFKKGNGFLGSIRLSNKLGLYRQDYCGCRLSKAERDMRKLRNDPNQTTAPGQP